MTLESECCKISLLKIHVFQSRQMTDVHSRKMNCLIWHGIVTHFGPVTCSDEVEDSSYEAKAKNLTLKAKAKAKARTWCHKDKA